MDNIALSGWKDPQAYMQDKSCYADEQGILYTRDDFLDACNGDSQVARRLFDLCYWQTPAFQFALYDESIALPTLSYHSRSAARWLIWRENPTKDQQSVLERSGWTAQDAHTWITEREEWSVPRGIAFRDTGTRDLTPQEAVELREELSRRETHLTEQAVGRHAQFRADMHTSLLQMSQSAVYLIDQLPRDLASWNRVGNTNGRGLRALFLTQLADTPEALWEALDRLPANCEFTVTEQTNLHVTAQVKGRRRGGDIVEVRSRETESTLIPVLTDIFARINQEPLRERLLRRWRKDYATCEERIKQEKHRLEWLPLHRRLYPDSFQNRQAEAEDPAKAILTFCGWQSAHTFTLEIMALLPNEITPDMARAFLTDLTKRHEETTAAQLEAEASSIWHMVEEGRSNAFSVLLRTASAFLTPDELMPDQQEAFL